MASEDVKPLVEVRKKGEQSVQGDILGQGETPVAVNESRFDLDEVILDPNSPLAVQIPEGSDADRSRIQLPFADALREGHVEAKFGTEAAPEVRYTDKGEVREQSGGKHTPVPTSERVETPEVHNEPELARTLDPKVDVEKESPASSKSGKKS